jgi:hypothetical protein
MTVQLTKEQIDAIKVELRKYGLNVLPMPGRGKAKAVETASPLSARIAEVSKMKFKTAGVKMAILKSLKLRLRSEQYRAANPYDFGTLLGMFGVSLGAIKPWPCGEGFDQRWQALRNGIGKGTLALPAPRKDYPAVERSVYAGADFRMQPKYCT